MLLRPELLLEMTGMVGKTQQSGAENCVCVTVIHIDDQLTGGIAFLKSNSSRTGSRSAHAIALPVPQTTARSHPLKQAEEINTDPHQFSKLFLG